MNLILLQDFGYSFLEVFFTTRTDTRNFKVEIDEIVRRANIAAIEWADDDLPEEEQDTSLDVFINYMSEKGFYLCKNITKITTDLE